MKLTNSCHRFLQAVVSGGIVLLLALPVAAQQPTSAAPTTDSATMQALLKEVHQLRLALERSSTVVPRLQLTIARFQMQQDRVDRLDRDFRTLHSQLGTESVTREHMLISIRQFEEQATQAQDQPRRRQLEDSAAGMKAELEQLTQRDQQARAQEAELAAQIRLEQAKLSELSRQLDDLDRKMQQQ